MSITVFYNVGRDGEDSMTYADLGTTWEIDERDYLYICLELPHTVTSVIAVYPPGQWKSLMQEKDDGLEKTKHPNRTDR